MSLSSNLKFSGGSGDTPTPFAQPSATLDPSMHLSVTTFSSGRFANLIQKNSTVRHGMQLIRGDATSAFILTLDTNGAATLCRGWRYLSSNDGPQVHTMENLREQLGYHGQWEARNGWIQVALKRDEGGCPSIGQYTNLIPNHAENWKLRCLPAVPDNHPLIKTSILLCQFASDGQREPVFGEDEPHTVAGLIEGTWIVLGAGNGLRIKSIANLSSTGTSPLVQVEKASEPILPSAWEQSF